MYFNEDKTLLVVPASQFSTTHVCAIQTGSDEINALWKCPSCITQLHVFNKCCTNNWPYETKCILHTWKQVKHIPFWSWVVTLTCSCLVQKSVISFRYNNINNFFSKDKDIFWCGKLWWCYVRSDWVQTEKTNSHQRKRNDRGLILSSPKSMWATEVSTL